MLQAQPVDPQHGRGRAEDARWRVSDVGIVGHVEQVAAQDEVGRAADRPAVVGERLKAVVAYPRKSRRALLSAI